ncbi:proline--tRNA ligase [Desmospora profundinema]|uniref:Proline--tRNA ligase n=1 Tax=Desmospora profundinema TaxID=1571184 RepID=A0ABU1IMD5_9BACL|nr:proline--tRNA ligase [Desmospora profundinema]MDR6225712.1 prolyl-tRNA synthetase [Desmospora profundinema]
MANEKEYVKEITPQSEDFSRWYIDTIRKADLMDYTPVRGCIAFKPDGYELWERIQQAMDRRFKETGHRNAYFPMLIPESFLQKEKEHVEGFNPELPWVTEAGGEKLEERLALRPTSETIIGHLYSQWIQSYRDLPVLLNQWANVFRWEKRTLPFLRTSEFLWQEGHTAHATEGEARQETMQMLEIYREVVERELAIPVWKGQKTPSERFAGAVDTFSIEAMMKDGKAVQAGTSHYLGENFAKGFDIQFLDRDNQRKYVHTTSWGTSTRLIGSMIMVHGDDRGLALPPRMSPVQMVMIPVGPAKMREKVMERFDPLYDAFQTAGIRVKADLREETPGWKYNEWEMRGVPVRLEIGPRDVDNNQVILVRRDTGKKVAVSFDGVVQTVRDLLEEIQQNMFEAALRFRNDHSHLHIDTLEDLKAHLADVEKDKGVAGWVLAGWCGDGSCELKIKEETKFTSRNIPFDPPVYKQTCMTCGQKAQHTVWFARAY